jgi:hypothetical protein
MAKRFWRIRGHKRFDTFVDITVPIGIMTEGQVKELLKCFAAKEGLTYEEIVGGYVRSNSKRANKLLDVQKNGPYPEYSCGEDPIFTAIVVDEAGNRVEYRPLPGG